MTLHIYQTFCFVFCPSGYNQVIRGCDKSSYSGCNYGSYYNVTRIYCVCTTNLCNGAQPGVQHRTAPQLFSAAVIAAAVVVMVTRLATQNRI
jgi:hypothetical protein